MTEKTILTTREDLATVVGQTIETVMERQMRILYTNIKQSAFSSRRRGSIGLLIGLEEVCSVLHCCKPTAKRWLETIFKPALIEGGYQNKRYVVDGDRLLKLLRKHNEQQRKNLSGTRPSQRTRKPQNTNPTPKTEAL